MVASTANHKKPEAALLPRKASLRCADVWVVSRRPPHARCVGPFFLLCGTVRASFSSHLARTSMSICVRVNQAGWFFLSTTWTTTC